jgi:hypothetical protein
LWEAVPCGKPSLAENHPPEPGNEVSGHREPIPEPLQSPRGRAGPSVGFPAVLSVCPSWDKPPWVEQIPLKSGGHPCWTMSRIRASLATALPVASARGVVAFVSPCSCRRVCVVVLVMTPCLQGYARGIATLAGLLRLQDCYACRIATPVGPLPGSVVGSVVRSWRPWSLGRGLTSNEIAYQGAPENWRG